MTNRELVRRVRRSVVKVQAGNGWGTGFAIAAKTFVTCSHVIDRATDVNLILDGGVRASARVISPGLDGLDLAVLHAEADVEPLQLARLDEVEAGDEGLIMGFPLVKTNPLLTQKAMVAARGEYRATPSRLVRSLILDAPINLGNSGGPFVTSDGRVAGIINARLGKLATFLEDFLSAQRYARDQAKALGIQGAAAMGVVQSEDRTELFKEFDTADAQQAFIDLTEHLRQFTNVGIGYAISTEYLGPWT